MGIFAAGQATDEGTPRWKGRSAKMKRLQAFLLISSGLALASFSALGNKTGVLLSSDKPTVLYMTEALKKSVRVEFTSTDFYMFKIFYKDITIYNTPQSRTTYGEKKGKIIWKYEENCGSHLNVIIGSNFIGLNCPGGSTETVFTLINKDTGNYIWSFRGRSLYIRDNAIYYFDTIMNSWPIRIFKLTFLHTGNSTSAENPVIFSLYPPKLPKTCLGYGDDELQGAIKLSTYNSKVLNFVGSDKFYNSLGVKSLD
ncbi:hypothetical protein [Deinococcus irradiatisoli]|uniref:hypothetical protein n=1 Tax=Deinococcus irradiatisoli TaxID=2202254 RepID=UPI0011B1D90F|nr:hypothetical protein [Deinococcus irradiatisoli]